MSTRANWHVEAPVLDDPGIDPFAMPIEEVGERIDLRDPKGTLELRLAELLHREGNLFNRGVTCPIKDRPDSTCHACPVSQAHTQEPLSVLCRIGREQESVVTELAVIQCRDE